MIAFFVPDVAADSPTTTLLIELVRNLPQILTAAGVFVTVVLGFLAKSKGEDRDRKIAEVHQIVNGKGEADRADAETLGRLRAEAAAAVEAARLAAEQARTSARLAAESAATIAMLRAQLRAAPPAGPLDVHVTNTTTDRVPVSRPGDAPAPPHPEGP